MIPLKLFGEPDDIYVVRSLSLEGRVERAVNLLKEHEPPEGYYLAFSGGKDSCACDALAKLAGVKYEKWYKNTTIDPPELIRFIKREHPDAMWSNSKHGNMFHRIANRPGPPPTRQIRWCCDEYKETNGGKDRVKIFGVRAAESPARAHRWRENSIDRTMYSAICPIVYWTDEQLWEFIETYSIPYCELYDEGWDRLGCVGCFLNPQSREREFKRWPKYAAKWKTAVIGNWENYRVRLKRNGEPYFHSKFASGEEFWRWWLNEKKPDVNREDCQSGLLWTNADEVEE